MRALIGGEQAELADHSPQPGRVLVRVASSARRQPPAQPRSASARTTFELLRARAGRVPEILVKDGPGNLLGKTGHLMRRTRQASAGRVASFAGTVVEDLADAGLAPGTRVAGISLTHPPDTELAVARAELLVPLPDEVSDDAGALLLWGAMAEWAAEAVGTGSSARVCGSGTVAELAEAALRARGIDVRPDAAAVIDAGGEPAGGASRVVGIDVRAAALAERWPDAHERVAASVDDLLRSKTAIVDLFYYDGSPDHPDWLAPQHLEAYVERAREPEGDVKVARFAGEHGAGRRTRLDLRPAATGDVKRISLVGAGEWPLGMILRQIVRHEGVALRGACDRRPEILHLAQQALPFEYVTTDYDELLADEETDMVVVASYHGSHAPLAVRALEAGKHTYVEKPPAVTHQQLDQLVDAARRSPGFLYVGYNRRFAPATRILEEQLATTDGPMSMSTIVHGIPLPDNHWYFWPSNGNRIISNTCHFIDYALQLAGGARPVRISATPSEVGRADRNVAVTISFDDGSLATIVYTDRGSDRSTTYYQTYRVLKGDVSAEIEDFRRMRIFKGGKRVARWRGALDVGHRGQMERVAEALRLGGPSPVDLETTERSARLVLAAAESAAAGGPVDLRATPSTGAPPEPARSYR